ncbi:class I SAM-dependent methyltransferase [Nonomuraea sp. NN258]|uniref:class I SAM-dependent DNA methyltransferase n=1 Tax=Nonomuraea antri TaxID=2730852 RepID=UPI0015695D87|nr:class I SAM-dependent methyltransferase [Nonomuraea antri]NRQ31660.1 class I SAM-dependent methyltransferase [Nonomuraea antri]
MYGADLADVYDAIYRGRGKDYRAEAARVAELIRQRRPDAASLLDVACGTGTHLAFFGEEFGHVAGLELSADMLAVARDRLPDVELHQGDMRDFRLDATFDAVTCLFSSIAYMETEDELTAALGRMAAHLSPGGVLIVEPWWFPEDFIDGYVAGHVVTVDGRTIARVSRTVRDGGRSVMDAHYVVASADSGVRHFTVNHANTLFPRKVYEAAFERAGLEVDHLEGGLSGRGLFRGVRTG